MPATGCQKGQYTMNAIPQDPMILLSYLNTKLRDLYPNLHELCLALNVNEEEIRQKLESIDYVYNPETNRFE